jgi:hypothetical protein
MKIAVLVSGEYREFDLAHKNWKFLNYPNVDCYFSTWDITKEKNLKLNIDIEEEVTLSRIEKFIKLKDYNIENQDVLNLDYIKKMFYHWDRVIDLMEKSQIAYDIAILIRPDIILCYNEQIDFMSFLDTIKENCLYGLIGPKYKVVDRLQDIMFMATGNSIKKLKNLPWDNELVTGKTDGHTWLGKHCLTRYDDILNIDSVKTIIVRRSNSRDISNDDLDTLFELSTNWYEELYDVKIPRHKLWL